MSSNTVKRWEQPRDWQDLLNDLTYDCCPESLAEKMANCELPEDIPVETVFVSDYWDHVRQQATYFDDRDWETVSDMIDLFLTSPEVLPPVVFEDDGTLHDGYHRMFALKMVKLESWVGVNLSKLIDLMVGEGVASE